jgi:hypothetical protein
MHFAEEIIAYGPDRLHTQVFMLSQEFLALVLIYP